MSPRRSYVEENTRERERLRTLVERLSDVELRRPVNDYWTVAAVLGHIAFWDARALVLAEKLERGEPFSLSNRISKGHAPPSVCAQVFVPTNPRPRAPRVVARA